MVDFYFGKNSGNAARTALALYEIGTPFTPRPLDLRQPRSPEYLAINPVGKVPTLVDGSTTLWESNAINWYLAEKHPQAALPGAGYIDRAPIAIERLIFERLLEEVVVDQWLERELLLDQLKALGIFDLLLQLRHQLRVGERAEQHFQ
jgi:glutathione S-transferase